MDDDVELEIYTAKMSGYEAAMCGVDCPQRDAFIRQVEKEAL